MLSHILRAAVVLLVVLLCTSQAKAAAVTFIVEYDQAGPVVQGSTVGWSLFVRADDQGLPSEYNGIAELEVNLNESENEFLSAGNISSAFQAYDTFSGGTGGNGTLTGVSAFLETQSATAVQAETQRALFASGSYVANVIGTHTLSPVVVNTANNTYFQTAGGGTESHVTFSPISTESDQITVEEAPTAVPEPGTMAALLLGTVGIAARRRFRRAKTAAAE